MARRLQGMFAGRWNHPMAARRGAMSTMNPLRFLGGMILEIGAVVAVLAILPGMGSREVVNPYATNSNGAPYNEIPNQVFFDARSSRLVDDPGRPPQPSGFRQNELIPVPPVSQQRYVENSLDYNSQRALDAAT